MSENYTKLLDEHFWMLNEAQQFKGKYVQDMTAAMERVDNSIASCTDCTEHVNVYAKMCITFMKENE